VHNSRLYIHNFDEFSPHERGRTFAAGWSCECENWEWQYEGWLVVVHFWLFHSIIHKPMYFHSQSFDIGPNDRTTFELVEQYRPLSMAYNPKNRKYPHWYPSADVCTSELYWIVYKIHKFKKVLECMPRHWTNPRTTDHSPSSFWSSSERTPLRRRTRTLDELRPKSHPWFCRRETRTVSERLLITLIAIWWFTVFSGKSEWMDWSKWSDCSSGERIRIRKCLEYNGVKCEVRSSNFFALEKSWHILFIVN
jgi:hypothetical protein